jgi:peptidylprolyl isomerase
MNTLRSLCAVALVASLVQCKQNADVSPDKGAKGAATTTTAAMSADPGIPAPPDVAAPPADAEKTSSGLASKVLTPGTGKDHPSDTDKVKVHYTGWTKDGKMFDSSVKRGEPTEFRLNQVIPGWTEGVQLMTKGEKRRFWIPGKLAYGEKPLRPGAPAGDLTFDIELLDFVAAPKPPPVPEDVKEPPATAKKTASGIAYRVLKPGTGKTHPTADSQVTVHYTGWTTDGKMFDTSVTEGEPATFGLGRVIKGWTEGVQLMVEGEKTRFWIPGPLAYGDKPTRAGAPAGMLVFDIELIKFK